MKFKKRLKSIRLQIGKILLDKRVNQDASGQRNIKKILFVHYDGKIGDFLVSSFVYFQMKEQQPDLIIDIVCAKANESFIKKYSTINHVYCVKNKGILAIYNIAKKLSKLDYDVVVNIAPILRNRDLMFIKVAAADINICYNKPSYKCFSINIDLPKAHVKEMYNEVLRRTGFTSNSTKSVLPDKVYARKEVAVFINSLPNKFRIVLNCFGTSRSRKLEKEKTFEIITFLTQNIHDCTIVLMSYHSVKEIIRNWINEWNLVNVFCFDETESIFDSIEIVKTSNLVVTPDTVFVHIAEALDIPLIAFYSEEEDNFNRWHPLEKTSVVGRYNENINSCSSEVITNTLQEMKAILNS